MIYSKFFKEKEKNTILKDQIKQLQKEVRYLKSKKYIKETAIKLLKDKGHTNAQAKFLITGKNPRKLKLKDVAPGNSFTLLLFNPDV